MQTLRAALFGRAGRTCLRPADPLPGRFAPGRGCTPNDLGSVGAATGLDAPYGHWLPRPALSRLGRELRPVLRVA